MKNRIDSAQNIAPLPLPHSSSSSGVCVCGAGGHACDYHVGDHVGSLCVRVGDHHVGSLCACDHHVGDHSAACARVRDDGHDHGAGVACVVQSGDCDCACCPEMGPPRCHHGWTAVARMHTAVAQ